VPPRLPQRRRKPAARFRTTTVRHRLVVGLLVILTVLIAAIGAAEILVLRHALYQRSAQGLRSELAVLASAPPPPSSNAAVGITTGSCAGLGPTLPPGPPGVNRGKGKAGAAPGSSGASAVAEALAAQSIASAIAGPDGTVLTCAAAGRKGHQTSFTVPASLPAALSTTTGYVTVRSQGHHLLAVSQPLGPDQAILVTDVADDDAAVRVVLAVTVLGGLVALVAAAALSVPLLRTGLSPLRKIARTADAIAGGDLDQRADLAHSPDDEVGQLGAAFDRMVDRLQQALVERDTVVEDLRSRDQTMRRFLADASHELRTPLTAIRGGAQVLRLGWATDPEDLAEALAHIQTETERMSRLVDDLLVLSRHEAGQPGSPRRLVDLGALVTDHAKQWSSLAPGRPILIDAESAWVTADADALLRVCTNLVENAEKYSPEHSSVAITVTMTADNVELTVADQGPGIPPADRQKVFERFYRGDPARTRATGGAGLGLAIVAGIVADHHGRVRVDDNQGGGTKVVIELPGLADPPPATPGPGT
jgi:two-component system OmpR family sensor kinase